MNNFIVIDSSVYLDSRLSSTDILIYGLIVALSKNNKRGCYAKNISLARVRNLSIRQVQFSLKKLKELNYVKIEYKKNERIIKTFIDDKILERNKINKSDIFHYPWWDDED